LADSFLKGAPMLEDGSGGRVLIMGAALRSRSHLLRWYEKFVSADESAG